MKQLIYEVIKVGLEINKRNPPVLVVNADGLVSNPGWKHGELMPKWNSSRSVKNGIYEFDFNADPSTETTTQVITPMNNISYSFKNVPKDLKKVIVYSRTNQKEAIIEKVKK